MRCHDFGFLSYGAPLGAPKFGQVYPCPDCHPVPVAVGIPDRLAGESFETWDPKLNPGMRQAYERCKAVAEGREWCALLEGDIGTGKSHLAAAALNASVHMRPGRFWPVGDLLIWLRQQMFDEGGPRRPEEEVLGFFAGEPFLLVLDDLGTEKSTEWAQQTLYQILNARYERKLPTILTTNAPERIDRRILSRYFEGTVVCAGDDVRAKGVKA